MRPLREEGSTGEKSTKSMGEHRERAREKWMDAERRIRQRMRVYPEKLRGILRSTDEYELEVDRSDLQIPAEAQESTPEEGEHLQRTTIRSIRRSQVDDMELEETEPEQPLAS